MASFGRRPIGADARLGASFKQRKDMHTLLNECWTELWEKLDTLEEKLDILEDDEIPATSQSLTSVTLPDLPLINPLEAGAISQSSSLICRYHSSKCTCPFGINKGGIIFPSAFILSTTVIDSRDDRLETLFAAFGYFVTTASSFPCPTMNPVSSKFQRFRGRILRLSIISLRSINQR